MLAAIAAKTLTIALFAEIAFADNTLYLFNGVGQLTPAGPPANPASTFPYGETFIGLGWLGKVSAIPQTTKVQAQNVTLSLSGIPANLVAEAIGQVRISGTATLWLGFFDASGNLLADPAQMFTGALDVPSLTDGGDTCSLSITCENSLISLNQAPERLFADMDQQIYFPGDLGMSFVENVQNMQLFWPAPLNQGSPYPVYATVNPSSIDVAVGATITVSATIKYSDGSTYTFPPGSGSGPSFIVTFASSNTAIATFDLPTHTIKGVSPGECSIMARFPGIPAGTPDVQYVQAATVFVH